MVGLSSLPFPNHSLFAAWLRPGNNGFAETRASGVLVGPCSVAHAIQPTLARSAAWNVDGELPERGRLWPKSLRRVRRLRSLAETDIGPAMCHRHFRTLSAPNVLRFCDPGYPPNVRFAKLLDLRSLVKVAHAADRRAHMFLQSRVSLWSSTSTKTLPTPRGRRVIPATNKAAPADGHKTNSRRICRRPKLSRVWSNPGQSQLSFARVRRIRASSARSRTKMGSFGINFADLG